MAQVDLFLDVEFPALRLFEEEVRQKQSMRMRQITERLAKRKRRRYPKPNGPGIVVKPPKVQHLFWMRELPRFFSFPPEGQRSRLSSLLPGLPTSPPPTPSSR